jgi:hypothetical protein
MNEGFFLSLSSQTLILLKQLVAENQLHISTILIVISKSVPDEIIAFFN